MTSHEELRRIGKECRTYAEVVVARIAAYMFDEYIDILALESVQFTIHQPQVSAVAIATDSPERTEGSQFLCHLHTTDISCVPDLVAGFEVVQVLLIPIAVRIAQYTYFLHITLIRPPLPLLLRRGKRYSAISYLKSFSNKCCNNLLRLHQSQHTGIDAEVIALGSAPLLARIVIIIGSTI